MKSKLLLKILIGFILYFILSFGYKLLNNAFIPDTCLNTSFTKSFKDLSSLKINATCDFNEMFNCQKWDEILITDAHYYIRAVGYLYSGILVPSYDQFQYLEGTYLVYFLKNNIIVSNPVQLYNDGFIFSPKSYKNNHIKIERKNAKFIYKKFEHSDYDFNTFELTENTN
jgi:hypothetical protein